jgi:phage terminase small subunit
VDTIANMKSNTLTFRQRMFIEEYSIAKNGTQAAIRAGYATRSARVTASQLLTKPHIRAAVGALEKQSAERLEITRQTVLEELRAVIELARQLGDAHAMIKGWQEISKICGYYSPERKAIEFSAAGKRLVSQLEALTDAELLAMAEGSVASR